MRRSIRSWAKKLGNQTMWKWRIENGPGRSLGSKRMVLDRERSRNSRLLKRPETVVTATLAASLNKRLGVVVRPVSDKEAQQYGLQGPKGVSIKSLQADGLMGKAGFEVDDIILAVNGQPVSDVQRFVNLVESLKPHQWVQFLVLDHRTGQTGYIRVMVN